jgi:hypothetical protein
MARSAAASFAGAPKTEFVSAVFSRFLKVIGANANCGSYSGSEPDKSAA